MCRSKIFEMLRQFSQVRSTRITSIQRIAKKSVQDDFVKELEVISKLTNSHYYGYNVTQFDLIILFCVRIILKLNRFIYVLCQETTGKTK